MDKESVKHRLMEDREERISRIIEWLQNMEPFSDDGDIPEPPVLDKERYEKYVIPNFIRCGAIPKDRLIVGKTYSGSCRNASEAVWLGDCFEYVRHKFGMSYPERINHFMDDDYTGTDVFVPVKEL